MCDEKIRCADNHSRRSSSRCDSDDDEPRRKKSYDGGKSGDKSSGIFNAEDWECDKCGNINFARRTSCNRCGKGAANSRHLNTLTEKDAARKKKRVGQEIGKAAAEKSHGLFSADDWECEKCGNVNWSRRQQCNMCNAPKFVVVEERTGYGGGYNEREEVEYIKRDESDDEFDEFGRKKKKFRTGKKEDDERSSSRRNPEPVESKSKPEPKPAAPVDDEDEDDEEDDEDEDGDLSKYDLSGWDEEEKAK